MGGGGAAVVGGGGGVGPPPLCAVVGVDRWPAVVVVTPRPNVVPGPADVVAGPLVVVPPASAVVVDDDETVAWATTLIGRGLPAELGMPAMAMPSPMQTSSRRTTPARLAAGPCQSMALKTNDREFFCGGSIKAPTSPVDKWRVSNGPVAPYKVGAVPERGHSNTVPTPLSASQNRRSGVCRAPSPVLESRDSPGARRGVPTALRISNAQVERRRRQQGWVYASRAAGSRG